MEDSPSTTATEEQLLGHIRRQGILLDELTVKCSTLQEELLNCYAKLSSLADVVDSERKARRRERKAAHRRTRELLAAFTEAKAKLIDIASSEIVARKWGEAVENNKI